MEDWVFNKFRSLIYEKSGITLGEHKVSLVHARIGKRMRVLGMESYKEYLKHVMEDNSGEELVNLLDVISTNVTHFFRENNHFSCLAEYMDKWLKSGQRRFRIWSSACSSGEEPYSIIMSINHLLSTHDIDFRILATDISTQILTRAQNGIFKEDKMKNVTGDMRKQFFDKHDDNGKINYQIKDFFKNKVLFKRLNLSTPPFPMKGPMDVVFCRNVMIYFDNEVRRRLLTEIFRLLKPGGILFVGHAESLTGQLSKLKSVKPSIYIKE